MMDLRMSEKGDNILGISKEIKAIYPYDEWQIIEDRFDVNDNFRNETVFALSNGYIGTRGTFEENYRFDKETGLEGTFLNGFYESEKIRYGEFNYGFPAVSQTMLNVQNGKIIKIKLDDEEFNMNEGAILEYKRALKLKEGILVRNITWKSPKGKEVRLTFKRVVSLTNKHLMAIKCEITPLNFDGEINIISEIDGDVINHTADTNPLIDYGPYNRVLQPKEIKSDNTLLSITSKTKNTKFVLCCASENKLISNNDYIISNVEEEYKSSITYQIKGIQNQKITFEKYISYVSSMDYDQNEIQGITNGILTQASTEGFDYIAMDQKSYVNDFFDSADVKIQGDDALQQGIRFNLFHLMQACGRDGKTGMGAKGITGEGYEGHNFWDTEMYIIQVLVYVSKDLAKHLLDFRYSTLDAARDRAIELGHPNGALYPWRTINGKEASAYYPLGTAQYHINADISYAFHKYVEVTDDVDYLVEKAAEVYIETARVWLDVGDFIKERDNKFCIHCVTGPDEYTALVDNNCYTNLMARENLLYAYDTVCWMKKNRLKEYEELANRLELKETELELFKKAADNMYFPYDENLEIYGQDDTFLYRKPWYPERLPEEKRSLLYKYYHPLFVFRHKMCKQADLLMAMYLLSNKFSKEEIEKHYQYYEPLTLNHSSLSTCILGILSCDLGYYDKAYEYFTSTSRLDLDDYNHNVHTGIHAANMAGTWMNIVFGFAGMKTYNDKLTFNPYIPKAWSSYSFNVTYKNQVINITINHQKVTYKLTKGDKLKIKHKQQELILIKEQEVVVTNDVI